MCWYSSRSDKFHLLILAYLYTGSGIGSADISSQIQNRVSRLTGGLSRLASRKIRKVAVVASAAHTLASSGVSAVSGAGADPVALGSMAMANAATATVTVTHKISQSININMNSNSPVVVNHAGHANVANLSYEEYDLWTQVKERKRIGTENKRSTVT